MGKDTLIDLKGRRSIRAYKPEQITGEELDAVLEAGSYAATGMDAQSAVMVAVQDRTLISRIEKLNAAVLGDPGETPFYGAPTVVNVLVDRTQVTPLQDGALVMGNLMNAAHALGLGSCWINRAKEVFESAEGKALLKEWGLDPAKYTGVAHCILGYAAEQPAARPRKKGYILKVQ
ncbi:MAG: nitroreductase family protein [Treponema sp.]|jgi:nitroreductase|nr:nitroreductase family protein [Treponema sp.]